MGVTKIHTVSLTLLAPTLRAQRRRTFEGHDVQEGIDVKQSLNQCHRWGSLRMGENQKDKD